jgi:hypothetical protein
MLKTIAILVLLSANVMIAKISSGQTPSDSSIKVVVPVLPDTQAPGSDPDFVWVNKNTHAYLCPKDSWYGKTKNGEYMSEWNAKALGYRPKYNKACNL